MIDFAVDEETALLRETAARFGREQLWPRLREHETARDVGPAARAAFGAIGLDRLEVPSSLGGSGLGSLARALVTEELAAGDAGAVLALDRLGPALYPIIECGGEQAVHEVALPIVEEPGARAVLVLASEAPPLGERTVDGAIAWVPADRVDLLVVLSREGAWAVDGGLHVERLRGAGLRASGGSSITLNGAAVRAVWRGPAGAARALARARLYVAAMLVGTMRAAAEYARAYAMERVAFGRPIAHHQALAFLLADMATAVDAARLLVHQGAWRADAGQDVEVDAAAAFAEASEAAMFVTPNALQILGGHGFMQDHPVEKFLREARALTLLLGGLDAARDDAARGAERAERMAWT